MPGKPFQSSLIPYGTEILRLRSCNPPVSYARIAELLRENYGLDIQRAAIGKFVKARSGGRKMYYFRKDLAARKIVLARQAQHAADSAGTVVAPSGQPQPQKPKFEFTYSERHNLKRLPPEEAAARRKKLEEAGH
jgi:hypothetical protein